MKNVHKILKNALSDTNMPVCKLNITSSQNSPGTRNFINLKSFLKNFKLTAALSFLFF